MGQVVPFIARVRDSGDWTAAERARLEDLADRLSEGGVKVEVIFGATDEGDPWCVVTDGDGDVLIHVARIDGKFVVHSAVDDMMSEGLDLHAALRDRLAATEAFAAPKSAVVLPFGLTARQGQTFLALVVATAFFHETAGIAEPAQAAELPAAPTAHEPPPPPPESDTDMPSHERQLATQGAALQDPDAGAAAHGTLVAEEPAQQVPAPAEPEHAPPPSTPLEPAAQAAHATAVLAEAAPSEPAPVVIRGTDGDDHLVGTAKNEHILGGAGNDTLQGGGGHDTLDGGAGNDRIEVTADVVAIGGKGADTFVIEGPAQHDHPDTLLGVVFDFSAAEGDRLVNAQGGAIKLPPPHPSTDPKTAPVTDSATHDFGPLTSQDHTTATEQAPPNLARVEIDLDGDGVADGYVLVGHGGPPPPADNAPADDAPAEHPITVVGHTLTSGDWAA